MMKYAVLLTSVLLMGCPKKSTTILPAYPEPIDIDLPDDDELDDLPEAGDKDIK